MTYIDPVRAAAIAVLSANESGIVVDSESAHPNITVKVGHADFEALQAALHALGKGNIRADLDGLEGEESHVVARSVNTGREANGDIASIAAFMADHGLDFKGADRLRHRARMR